MPAHDSGDIAARDPAIPGLAVILDEGRLLDTLSQVTGQPLEAVELSYIRYKPGMNCLVRMLLRSDDACMPAYAKAFGRDVTDKLAKARQRQQTRGSDGRYVIDSKGIIVNLFPHDDKLKQLSRLDGSGARSRLLSRVMSTDESFSSAQIHTLQYKPERRYVAALELAGRRIAALKFYTRSGFARARKVHDYLSAHCADLFPLVIGLSRRHRVFASEWMPGTRLDLLWTHDDFNIETMARLGRQLAALHAIRPAASSPLPRQSSTGMAGQLLELAATAGFLVPQLADEAHRLAATIGRIMTTLPVSQHLIHGDCYAKQVLCDSGGRIQLVDSDDVAIGHPAADIGLFLAHLDRDVLRARVSHGRARELEHALLQGCGVHAGYYRMQDIQLYAAAGLLQLLHHPFRACEAGFVGGMQSLLEACNARLERAATRQWLHRQDIYARPVATDGQTSAALADSRMPYLATLLHPATMSRALASTSMDSRYSGIHVSTARIRRFREGRRCLIEYTARTSPGTGDARFLELVGKVRARGFDHRTWQLNRTLYTNGFSHDTAGKACVPRPVAGLPQYNMWLQEKVHGQPAWQALCGSAGDRTARDVAAALNQLHRHGPLAQRSHTPSDEIRILDRQLRPVMQHLNGHAERISRILAAARRLAARLECEVGTGIHRDCYHDQLIIKGRHVYLLDLDLYAAGDPALDVGNFIAHLQEQGLRLHGRADSMQRQSGQLVQYYLDLHGKDISESIDIYRKLSLVRHIAISQRIDARCCWTLSLIDLCEQELGIASNHSIQTPETHGVGLCT